MSSLRLFCNMARLVEGELVGDMHTPDELTDWLDDTHVDGFTNVRLEFTLVETCSFVPSPVVETCGILCSTD